MMLDMLSLNETTDARFEMEFCRYASCISFACKMDEPSTIQRHAPAKETRMIFSRKCYQIEAAAQGNDD